MRTEPINTTGRGPIRSVTVPHTMLPSAMAMNDIVEAVTRYLMAITIESGPTSGSTRVDEKPAAFIQPAQSAPV